MGCFFAHSYLTSVIAHKKGISKELTVVSTHPDIAALVTPLLASVKRGFYPYFSLPSFRRRRREGDSA
jgi:non-ribosomal peptide synthetase component E (peptide arylation enzyme)